MGRGSERRHHGSHLRLLPPERHSSALLSPVSCLLNLTLQKPAEQKSAGGFLPVAKAKSPARFPKRHISQCETYRLAVPNGLFLRAAKAVFQARNGAFWGDFCGFLDRSRCTIGAIMPTSLSETTCYGCTPIFRVFAHGGVPFSNTRNMEGKFRPKLTVFNLVNKRRKQQVS